MNSTLHNLIPSARLSLCFSEPLYRLRGPWAKGSMSFRSSWAWRGPWASGAPGLKGLWVAAGLLGWRGPLVAGSPWQGSLAVPCPTAPGLWGSWAEGASGLYTVQLRLDCEALGLKGLLGCALSLCSWIAGLLGWRGLWAVRCPIAHGLRGS